MFAITFIIPIIKQYNARLTILMHNKGWSGKCDLMMPLTPNLFLHKSPRGITLLFYTKLFRKTGTESLRLKEAIPSYTTNLITLEIGLFAIFEYCITASFLEKNIEK